MGLRSAISGFIRGLSQKEDNIRQQADAADNSDLLRQKYHTDRADSALKTKVFESHLHEGREIMRISENGDCILPFISAEELLRRNAGQIALMQRLSDFTPEDRREILDPLLLSLAKKSSIFPASEMRHDSFAGGLFSHLLSTAVASLDFYRRYGITAPFSRRFASYGMTYLNSENVRHELMLQRCGKEKTEEKKSEEYSAAEEFFNAESKISLPAALTEKQRVLRSMCAKELKNADEEKVQELLRFSQFCTEELESIAAGDTKEQRRYAEALLLNAELNSFADMLKKERYKRALGLPVTADREKVTVPKEPGPQRDLRLKSNELYASYREDRAYLNERDLAVRESALLKNVFRELDLAGTEIMQKAAPYERRKACELLLILTAFAHDLGKVISDADLFAADGERLDPLREDPDSFFKRKHSRFVRMRYRDSRKNVHEKYILTSASALMHEIPNLKSVICRNFDPDSVLSDPGHPAMRITGLSDIKAATLRPDKPYPANFTAAFIIKRCRILLSLTKSREEELKAEKEKKLSEAETEELEQLMRHELYDEDTAILRSAAEKKTGRNKSKDRDKDCAALKDMLSCLNGMPSLRDKQYMSERFDNVLSQIVRDEERVVIAQDCEQQVLLSVDLKRFEQSSKPAGSASNRGSSYLNRLCQTDISESALNAGKAFCTYKVRIKEDLLLLKGMDFMIRFAGEQDCCDILMCDKKDPMSEMLQPILKNALIRTERALRSIVAVFEEEKVSVSFMSEKLCKVTECRDENKTESSLKDPEKTGEGKSADKEAAYTVPEQQTAKSTYKDDTENDKRKKKAVRIKTENADETSAASRKTDRNCDTDKTDTVGNSEKSETEKQSAQTAGKKSRVKSTAVNRKSSGKVKSKSAADSTMQEDEEIKAAGCERGDSSKADPDAKPGKEKLCAEQKADETENAEESVCLTALSNLSLKETDENTAGMVPYSVSKEEERAEKLYVNTSMAEAESDLTAYTDEMSAEVSNQRKKTAELYSQILCSNHAEEREFFTGEDFKEETARQYDETACNAPSERHKNCGNAELKAKLTGKTLSESAAAYENNNIGQDQALNTNAKKQGKVSICGLSLYDFMTHSNKFSLKPQRIVIRGGKYADAYTDLSAFDIEFHFDGDALLLTEVMNKASDRRCILRKSSTAKIGQKGIADAKKSFTEPAEFVSHEEELFGQ